MAQFLQYLYQSVCSIGLLTAKTARGIFVFAPQKLFLFLRDYFHIPPRSASVPKKRSAFMFRRTMALALTVIIVLSMFIIMRTESGLVRAVRVSLDGETIGYVETEDDASLAEGIAQKALSSTDEAGTRHKNTRINRNELLSASALADALLKKMTAGLLKVTDVYINGKLICAVQNEETAAGVFADCLSEAKEDHPNASVSFTETISYKPAYCQNSADIWSAAKLKLAINSLNLLSVQHTTCEKKISAVDYDTVEIQTNSLFIGDSRIDRAGQAGQELVLNLVTYIGNERLYSQKLTSVKISDPVSQIVEKGMRAQNITIGNYTVTQTTGYFCWPVIGLHTITSKFGARPALGYHHGMDISGANAAGSLVVAAASGTVVEAGWNTGGYGNYVIIDHGNGVETVYAHMLNNSLLVSAGETVTKGQAIGHVGNTGYSFGAHLHFEVRIKGVRVNPAPYLGLDS